MKKIGYFLLALLHLKGYAQTTLLLSWDFNLLTGAEATVHATTVAACMDGGAISRGTGITATVLNNSFHSSGWTTTNSLSDAIANEDYYQWTAQIKSGSVVSLQSLLANFRRSASGPDHFQWRYSLNGVDFFNAGSEIVFTNTTTNGVAQTPIDLSSILALQQLNATMPVCFRLYGYNATGATGTFSIGRLTGDDLTLMGIPLQSLPHQLGDLYLKSVGDSVQICWTIHSQESAIQCMVEKSIDGRNFETIRTLPVEEGFHTFQVKDQPNAPLVYYRIRVAESGIADHWSRVVVFRPQRDGQFNIYPNPATHQIQINAPVNVSNAQIQLFNSMGRLIRMMTVSNFPVTISLAGLPSGLYHLKFDNTWIKTFIKRF